MTGRPVRLVVYTDAGGVGGAEICLGNLVAELPQSRYAITVLATDEAVGASVAARRPDVSLETVPPVRDKKDLPPIVAHLRALRRLRPQLVHLNLRTPYSCQYGLLAALTTPGVRTVAVEHLPLASQDGVSRWIKRRTSTRLAAHVAVGVRAARLIEAEVGLPPGSIRTIPNGVPLVDLPAAPRLAAGAVIGSLGRFDEQKGYDVLVRALPQLPGVTAVLVGDGRDRGAVEQLAAAQGVADRLRVVGWSDEPRAYLAGFDVFVLPSRYEGLPLVVLEAMLAGLPVVASDVGSVAEAVVDGETGLLVRPDDPAAFAQAVGRVLADVDLRRRLGEAGAPARSPASPRSGWPSPTARSTTASSADARADTRRDHDRPWSGTRTRGAHLPASTCAGFAVSVSPRFSVVMPAFNAEQTVGSAICSVLRQTCRTSS